MQGIDVADALGAGFGVIRRKPLTVVIWGLLIGVMSAAGIALVAPTWLALIRNFPTTGQPPADPSAMIAQMMSVQAGFALFGIVSFFVRAVLFAAIFRSILKPQESGFAYLRLGMVELLLAVFMFGLGIAMAFAIVVCAIPAAIVVAALGAAHQVAAAAFLACAAVVGLLVVLIWFALRISLIGPMIVDRGGLPFDEAWAMTRGRVGSLLLLAVALFVILLAMESVIFGLTGAVVLSMVGGLAPGAGGWAEFVSRPWPAILAGLAPLLVIGWLVWSLFLGAASTILLAPWAEVVRRLTTPEAAAPAAPPVPAA